MIPKKDFTVKLLKKTFKPFQHNIFLIYVFDLCWFYLITKKLEKGYKIMLMTEDNSLKADPKRRGGSSKQLLQQTFL